MRHYRTEEEKDKIEELSHPEHEPVIPLNYKLDREKEERRKLELELRKKNKKYESIILTKSGKLKTANQLTLEEQEIEFLRCATDPIYFIETYLTIFDQTQGTSGKIVPFKLFEYQIDLITTYTQFPYVIPNKYRQAGISTCTCAYISWYIMFNQNRTVAIVADKLETARDELMNDVIMFIDGCPSWLKPKTGKESANNLKDTQKLKRYDNGSSIGAFSSKGLRGCTPTLLFWDEVAWTEKAGKFWTAAKPTLQTGGNAILVSTPNSLDEVYYKTFDGAIKGQNNFKAVELWWYNDPRYNKDLCWLKNKGKINEIKLVDENWNYEYRKKLVSDGWEASSPWFESQVRDSNGDMRKIAQELLCVFGLAEIKIKDKKTDIIENITIGELHKRLDTNIDLDNNVLINEQYEILNSSGNFVNFFGIQKSDKRKAIKVTLENNKWIIVGEDHIFISNNVNMFAKSLLPNVAYLTTVDGDFYVKSVEPVGDCDLYDIVDSKDCEYYANGFLNHNCSFLGSGDNFIAEEFLKRINENEIRVPIRQEYTDLNMWIYEDPIPGEQYVMGIDAAPGHGDDNCTINILKFVEIIEEKTVNKNGKLKKERTRHSKIEQVAEYYGKTSPQILAEISTIYGKQYNNAYAVVDITGGYGTQVVDKLFGYGYSAENIHYSEISHKPSRDRLQGYIKNAQKNMMDGTIIMVDLVPGFFIGNNRASVLLELQRSIHMGDVVIRSVRLLNELKTFITVAGNRVADHKRSFHDDSIMGFAIGLFTINYEMKKFNIKKDVSEKIINAMINVNTQDNQDILKRQNQHRKQISNNPYAIHGWLFK